MKQLLQNIKEGNAEIVEVPIPDIKSGHILVKNHASVVSSGTERMVVEFAEKNLLMKAKSRPDLVKQVLDKAQREGIIPTIQAALNRLDTPMALGYSSAGEVISVGEGVENIKPGDRVACAGGGFACHAEYVLIPKNLFAKIPDSVSYEDAAFSTLGAISLHGFRIAAPQIGEKVAIIGLGLLGLIMIDVCKAAGLKVFGTDLDQSRVDQANSKGVVAVHRELALDQGLNFTENRGFDVVFICADTNSNDPIELAGQLARDKGTVVAVGAVGLEIPRKIYYEKEINVLISRSYGPGRYDHTYEEQGKDYPYGYVRWTEGRNLSAIIDLLESKKLEVKSLITHRFPIEEGVKAYETITSKNNEKFLGVIIQYPDNGSSEKLERRVDIQKISVLNLEGNKVSIGILGAGLYASAVFLPIIQKTTSVQKLGICSAKGLSARQLAKKYDYEFACTDEAEIFNNNEINTVVILTRHSDHARQIIRGLQANKHIYCEKPLALNTTELLEIKQAYKNAQSNLMVGFNRRFSPFILKAKDFIKKTSEPKMIHYRVNAGFIPANHWVHDPNQGGGRIVGEGCHFIDLCIYLADSKPVSIQTIGLPNLGKYNDDNVVINMIFNDGSIATIEYLANGDKSVEKETLEIFCGGKVVQLIDFRKLILTSNGKKTQHHSRFAQDKGHLGSWQAFINSIELNFEVPITFEELFTSSLATLLAAESLRKKETIFFDEYKRLLEN
ncbi:MAG: bi-domain-containing oxidoreductase [Anaerolineaceae bacterium]|nr:bi-domain-containing oxidoreductase [Anaerolineaceae bacterium]